MCPETKIFFLKTNFHCFFYRYSYTAMANVDPKNDEKKVLHEQARFKIAILNINLSMLEKFLEFYGILGTELDAHRIGVTDENILTYIDSHVTRYIINEGRLEIAINNIKQQLDEYLEKLQDNFELFNN